MKKYLKLLFIWFIGSVIVKFLLAQATVFPSIFADEQIYYLMGYSALSGAFSDSILAYMPLYYFVIAPAHLLASFSETYLAIKFINSLLSASIVFPVFFLAQEFTSKNRALVVAALSSVLPIALIFPGFIMSENLFLPLVAATMFFAYKLNTNKSKYAVLAGLFLGLTILTRLIAVGLILPFAFLFCYAIYTNKKKLALNAMFAPIIAILTILPWALYRAFNYGFSLSGILGSYAGDISASSYSIPSFFIWTLLYAAFFIFASGVLPFILSANNIVTRNKKAKFLASIVFSSLLGFIIIAANHNAANKIMSVTLLPFLTGRPLGRYIMFVLPFFLVLAFAPNYKLTNLHKHLIYLLPVTLVASQLVFFTLLPINNTSLTLLGVVAIALQSSISATTIAASILLIVVLFMALAIAKYNYPKIIAILTLFYLLTSVAGLAGVHMNSQVWLERPESIMGRKLEQITDPANKIIFDQNHCTGKLSKDSDKLCDSNNLTTLSFWIPGLTIGDIDEEWDYAITKTNNLKEEIILEVEGYYVYKKFSLGPHQ